MSENNFLRFQSFSSIEMAKPLLNVFDNNNLSYQIEDLSNPVDIIYSGGQIPNQIGINIKQEDFEQAHTILEKLALEAVSDLPEDHYLYDFNDDELMEILIKPDEWSKEDVLLSKKILNERGHQISDKSIEKLKEERLMTLRKPERGHYGWLISGLIMAILGGLLGVFIGWFHWNSKKTDPTGYVSYSFDEQTRKLGKAIFWIGLVSSCLWLSIWLAKNLGL